MVGDVIKRERLEKKMYSEMRKGNFDQANKIRAKIVDFDTATLAKKLQRKPI